LRTPHEGQGTLKETAVKADDTIKHLKSKHARDIMERHVRYSNRTKNMGQL